MINTDNIESITPIPSGEGGCFIDLMQAAVGQPRIKTSEDYAILRKRLKEYGVLITG